jgi:hypothetical protein
VRVDRPRWRGGPTAGNPKGHEGTHGE